MTRVAEVTALLHAGLSTEQIAAQLGCSVPTVRRALRDALDIAALAAMRARFPTPPLVPRESRPTLRPQARRARGVL